MTDSLNSKFKYSAWVLLLFLQMYILINFVLGNVNRQFSQLESLYKLILIRQGISIRIIFFLTVLYSVLFTMAWDYITNISRLGIQDERYGAANSWSFSALQPKLKNHRFGIDQYNCQGANRRKDALCLLVDCPCIDGPLVYDT